MKLDGRAALVTGGTQGIGSQIVRRLAVDGAKVAFTGRNGKRGGQLQDELVAQGATVMFLQGDVSVESDVQRAVDRTAEAFGSLDILVNNAAPTDVTGPGKPDTHVTDVDNATLNKILAVQVFGVIWSSKYAIPHMRKAGGGSIIHISASSSVRAIEGRPGYQAAKGAVNSLTRQMAVDYGLESIRTNAVIVGFINTGEAVIERMLENADFVRQLRGIIPSPRLGDPADIAAAVSFLASDDAAFINGILLPVDGGMTSRMSMPDTISAID